MVLGGGHIMIDVRMAVVLSSVMVALMVGLPGYHKHTCEVRTDDHDHG
jgi:hypothetical protein